MCGASSLPTLYLVSRLARRNAPARRCCGGKKKWAQRFVSDAELFPGARSAHVGIRARSGSTGWQESPITTAVRCSQHSGRAPFDGLHRFASNRPVASLSVKRCTQRQLIRWARIYYVDWGSVAVTASTPRRYPGIPSSSPLVTRRRTVPSAFAKTCQRRMDATRSIETTRVPRRFTIAHGHPSDDTSSANAVSSFRR